MWSVRSWFIKPLFCVWHEELCWQTAGILSVALCEWQRRFLALFSSTASLPGLFINSLFWDVFQRLQDSPILPLLDCVWLLSSPYVWCVLDSIASHLPLPGMTKRVPIRLERDFGALLGSLPGRKEPWESRVCEWQGSRVARGVCVWRLISLFRRSMSNLKLSKALSLEMIQLKEKVARFSSTSPFQSLEIIATLGVGGFGRVELVRGLRFKHLSEAFWLFCFILFYI